MTGSCTATDVLILGAGHNGLVAGCYLARAGLDVLVVEAADTIGGCTRSGALIEGAPDHLVSAGAGDVITLRASTVVSELGLRGFGFTEIEMDPGYIHLGADGTSIAFWRDPARTAREIGRFSARDARAFLELSAVMDAGLDAALPMMATNARRPDGRALLAAVGGAARHPRRIAQLAALATTTAVEAIDARFEHPAVRDAIAMMAAFGPPITASGTGTNLLILGLLQRVGMSRPRGGMQALPDALAACLASHGGRIRTGAPVAELAMAGDRVTGLVLESGERLEAQAVLASCDPRQTLTRLLPAQALTPRQAARARGIPTLNGGATHFKVDLALTGRLALARHQAWRSDDVGVRAPTAVVGTLEEMVAAVDAAAGGRLPEHMPFVGLIATAADDSLAPPGQDTLYLWAGWTAHRPHEGWEALREPVGEMLVAGAGRYYDGIGALELARNVDAWPQLTERFRVPDGNVLHVDVSLLRSGPLRPALGFGGYRTPVGGLFLTGAGTHPGPSVSGIPGQLAAREVLRQVTPAGVPPSMMTRRAERARAATEAIRDDARVPL